MLNKEKFDRIVKFHEWMIKIGNVHLYNNNSMVNAYEKII
jgi:hypothetical protein